MKKTGITIALSAAILIPVPAKAACVSLAACVACVQVAVMTWRTQSEAAYEALDSSISGLNSTFASSSSHYSSEFVNATENQVIASMRVSSSKIKSQLIKDLDVQKRMLDEQNRQDEERSEMRYSATTNLARDEDYSPENLPENLLDAYGSQQEKNSDLFDFVEQYRHDYFDLLHQPRQGIFDKFVLDSTYEDQSNLLYGGVIKNDDDIAKLTLATQQVLFGADTDPFRYMLSAEDDPASLSRDQLKLQDRVVWTAQIKPAMEFFAFDQSLRVRPDEDKQSLMEWLDERVQSGVADPEGLTHTMTESSPKNLVTALAVEEKKRLLIKELQFQVNQISTQIDSTMYAMRTLDPKDQLRLRNQLNDGAFDETSKAVGTGK